MSIERPDEEDDLRRALESRGPMTSARHDDAVLRAARELACEDTRTTRSWSRVFVGLGQSSRWAAVAAGLAAIGVAVWIGWLVLERGAQGDSSPRLLASVVLSAGTIRGEDEVARVDLPPGPGVVRLQLDLATVTGHPAYRAELFTRTGRMVWNAADLEPRATEWGRAVFVDLESGLLENGEHELMLQRATEVGSAEDPVYYYFDVQRRN